VRSALAALVLLGACAADGGADRHLTGESLQLVRPGVSRESDVREILGAPARVQTFPRMERVAWSYPAFGIQPLLIIVQFSKDGVVREAYVIDDPDFVSAAE
jgi:outer membrane protein assembly factor BamE (lipoprotein component of BamABCDE complex)